MIAKLSQFKTIPVFQFKNLNNFSEITHGITTRAGGVSNDNYGTLNLSLMVNDEIEHVKQNRNLVAEAFGVEPENLKIPRQQHTNHVLQVNKDQPLDLSADAFITHEKGIALAVLLADCVPILLYDKKNQVIASIHAGWKGTVANIALATVFKMQQVYNSKPEDIIAGIGPSIGPEVYEVGLEIKEAADNSLGQDHGTIEKREEKYFFNLWKANQLQLIKSGVLAENIEIAEICTYKNHEVFFSARRIKPATGRFAAVIKLN